MRRRRWCASVRAGIGLSGCAGVHTGKIGRRFSGRSGLQYADGPPSRGSGGERGFCWPASRRLRRHRIIRAPNRTGRCASSVTARRAAATWARNSPRSASTPTMSWRWFAKATVRCRRFRPASCPTTTCGR